MKYRPLHLPVLAFLLLFFSASDNVLAGPTGAHLSLSNTARLSAANYVFTNRAGTNIIVAEIHGVMDLLNTNTNAFIVPGGPSVSFTNTVTNKANIGETRLLLILTNCLTNSAASCGDWTVEALSNGKPVMTTASRLLSVPNGVQKFLLAGLAIPPGGLFFPGIRLTAPAATGPSSWLSVQLVTRVVTNAAGYVSPDGTLYGGKTNVVLNARSEVASPNISLFKFVDKITNLLTQLNDPVPGAEIWYRISFSNSGIGQGRNLSILDFLPVTNIVFLANTVTNSGFATNFTVSGYDRSGAPLTLVAVDSNVRRIRFSAPDIFSPGDKGVIRYRIRIR